MSSSETQPSCKKALKALVWEGVLCEPLAFMVQLLPFIMVKELGASEFLVALYIALKPASALFSVYCVSLFAPVFSRYYRYLISTGVLSRFLFCLFPIFTLGFFRPAASILVLLSMAIYMMLYRAAMPMWHELVRIKIPDKEKRAKALSLSSTLGYLLGVFLSFALGSLLQSQPKLWSLFFLASALIGGAFVWLQSRIPQIDHFPQKSFPPESTQLGKKSALAIFLDPLFNAAKLLKAHRPFFYFQVGFTLCGASIMMIYAVMAHFFVEKLLINYTQISLAIACFRALGYLFTSRLWALSLSKEPDSMASENKPSKDLFDNKEEITRFFSTSRFVFLAVALFPVFLLLSATFPSFRLFFLYSAFFFYGTGLAGNHLVWHLSPAAFSSSKKECSASYTQVQLLAVGLRGMLFPQIGAVLGFYLGVETLLLLSSILSICAAWWMHACLQYPAPKKYS